MDNILTLNKAYLKEINDIGECCCNNLCNFKKEQTHIIKKAFIASIDCMIHNEKMNQEYTLGNDDGNIESYSRETIYELNKQKELITNQ